MGLQGYVGSAGDVKRIQKQEEEREKQKKKFEEAQKRLQRKDNDTAFKQFVTSSEALEQAFRNETVGLVSREQFVEKRATLKERFEEKKREKQKEENDRLQEERRRKRSKMQANASKLSFLGDDEEEEIDLPLPKVGKFGKKLKQQTLEKEESKEQAGESVSNEKGSHR